ncbi:histidine phosphatase family protein [Chloroflexota bacterium]
MDKFYITLLRHAESTGNAAKCLQGQNNAPLTKTGERQAEALAEYWQTQEDNYDLIISSPQKRARSTAQIIAKTLSITLQFDPAWMERAFGILEGLPYSEMLEQNPPLDFYHPYDQIGESGECLMDLYLRASKAVQCLLKNPPGSYLIVSHGALLNMAMYSMLGLSPHNYVRGPRFHFKNTGFSELTYEPDTRVWRVFSFNKHPHWNRE